MGMPRYVQTMPDLPDVYAEDPVRSVIRLCFAKQPATLAAGIDALRAARRLFA